MFGSSERFYSTLAIEIYMIYCHAVIMAIVSQYRLIILPGS